MTTQTYRTAWVRPCASRSSAAIRAGTWRETWVRGTLPWAILLKVAFSVAPALQSASSLASAALASQAVFAAKGPHPALRRA